MGPPAVLSGGGRVSALPTWGWSWWNCPGQSTPPRESERPQGRRRGEAQSDPCPRQQCQNGESEETHAQFLKALQNAVSTFVNRMKSNHVRGRSITNDSAVLSLFQSINSMHPQLLELLNQLDERRRTCRPAPAPQCTLRAGMGTSHASRWLGPWKVPWGGTAPGRRLLGSLHRGLQGRWSR